MSLNYEILSFNIHTSEFISFNIYSQICFDRNKNIILKYQYNFFYEILFYFCDIEINTHSSHCLEFQKYLP